VQLLPEDMAATTINRPRNHAHEPDAAAAVDQVDASPHLRVAGYKEKGKGTRATLAHLPRTHKKNPRKQRRAGQPARQPPSGAHGARGELHAAACVHTDSLTSSWPSSSAASANTFRWPALLPQKTQIVRNLLGTAAAAAAAPSPMPIGHTHS
jgi:hypothetical protein